LKIQREFGYGRNHFDMQISTDDQRHLSDTERLYESVYIHVEAGSRLTPSVRQ